MENFADYEEILETASINVRERSYQLAARIDQGQYGRNVTNIRHKSIMFDMFRVMSFDGTVQVVRELRRIVAKRKKDQLELERRSII